MSVTPLTPPTAPTLVIAGAKYIASNGIVFGSTCHLCRCFYRHLSLKKHREQNFVRLLDTFRTGGMMTTKVGNLRYVSLRDFIVNITPCEWKCSDDSMNFCSQVAVLYEELCHQAGIQLTNLMPHAGMTNYFIYNLSTLFSNMFALFIRSRYVPLIVFPLIISLTSTIVLVFLYSTIHP